MSAALASPALHDAAPALLSALVALREDHGRVEPHHEDLCPICRRADAAIAMANGREHFERQYRELIDTAVRESLIERLDNDELEVMDDATAWLWAEHSMRPGQVTEAEREPLLNAWLDHLWLSRSSLWTRQVEMTTRGLIEAWL